MVVEEVDEDPADSDEVAVEEEVAVEDSADSEPAVVPAKSSSVVDEVMVVMVVEDSEELEPVAIPARS